MSQTLVAGEEKNKVLHFSLTHFTLKWVEIELKVFSVAAGVKKTFHPPRFLCTGLFNTFI